jgi:hypothetical protein
MFSTLLASALAVCTVGCHRATEADCDRIIDKLVELELKEQGINDPRTIELRREETRAKKREELIHSCVGKRVSQRSMDCIQRAQSSSEVTDKCLH